MITLFIKKGCPFCQKVLNKMGEINITPSLKDISDEKNREELEKRGGMIQVPFLIDDEKGTEMYESDDIIDFLEKNYGEPAKN